AGAAAPPPARPWLRGAGRGGAEPIAPAYSPIVLAGVVRMIDAGAIAAIGLAIHLVHVFPTYGFAWYYAGAFIGIAVLAVLAFQVADIYDVQAFRSPVRQIARLSMTWHIGFILADAVPPGHGGRVLRQVRGHVLPRLARRQLHRRLPGAGRLPRRAGGIGAPLDPRGPARTADDRGGRRRGRRVAHRGDQGAA